MTLAMRLWFLIDPVTLGSLPLQDLFRLEPQSNLFLGVFNAIRAVANVATNVLTDVSIGIPIEE